MSDDAILGFVVGFISGVVVATLWAAWTLTRGMER